MTLDENNPEPKARLDAFTQALADLGWNDGRNVRMDLRWAGSDTNRMRALAQELVRLQPDIIVATSTPATVAVQRETRTIPIVFGNVSDHVVMGITPRSTSQAGISPASPSWKPRWAESSLSCSGRSRLDSSGPQSCSILTRLSHRLLCHHLRRPPGRSRFVPITAPVHDDEEIETAIIALGRGQGGGLVVMPSLFTTAHRAPIIAAAARNNIPAVYGQSNFTKDGGLLSYGPDGLDIWRRAATYVDRILRGAKPGDLRVQFPTKFELVINLKTAKTLGLTIPLSILALADEVIE
jgi:putative tryptophan/tyrosine transport system substrate-binding protein